MDGTFVGGRDFGPFSDSDAGQPDDAVVLGVYNDGDSVSPRCGYLGVDKEFRQVDVLVHA